MGKTKLTLHIEEDLVKREKVYAAKVGKSVSDLVADYFPSFQVERKEEQRLSLKRASLKGMKGILKSKWEKQLWKMRAHF